jgi:DNA-binding SARP family transcriptional activator
MSRLTLSLLGAPTIELNGKEVRVDTRKTLALIAYLAVTRRRHRRDSLVLLLWPESGQARGRALLRNCLYAANKKLGGSWIQADQETVGLEESAELRVDVNAFRLLMGELEAQAHGPGQVGRACLAPLREAVALYQGDFLSGFTLKDSVNFDNWQLTQAEALRADLSGAFDLLTRFLGDEGRWQEAIRSAGRWLELDPAGEAAHRRLMELYALSGRRSAALRQYDECVRALEDDLGVAPSDRTVALFESIREDRVDLGRSRTVAANRHRQATPMGSPLVGPPGRYAPFVGRGMELARLSRALEGASRGSGGMVVLVGKPGIGKTRTAREFTDRCELAGTRVLWGRCYESDGSPPYGPWIAALLPYVRECDPDHLRSSLTIGGADLLALLPEIGDRLPDSCTPSDLPSLGDRARLFEALKELIVASAPGGPVVVVLDNLHWADRASLLFLEHIAPELAASHVLILGTYRDTEIGRGHPLSHALAELAKEEGFDRIRLSGLGDEEVSRYVSGVVGHEVPESGLAVVRNRVEGNPLFLRELAKLIAEDPSLEANLERRIPEGVKEAIGRRVDRLSGTCSEVLALASVVGRRFGFRVLDRIMEEIDGDEVLGALEEALAAGLIDEEPDRAGRYRFAHAMIRQTLLDDVSTTRRVRWHAEIAQALQKLPAGDDDGAPAQLLHHLREASALLGTAALVLNTVEAAERALDRYAAEDALAMIDRTLAITREEDGDRIDDEVAELLRCHGRALAQMTRVEEAANDLRRAFDHFEETGNNARAVRSALTRVIRSPASCWLTWAVGDLVERALELAVPDSEEHGWLLACSGCEPGRDHESGGEQLRRALEIARLCRQPTLEILALTGLGRLEYCSADPRRAEPLFSRAVEMARTHPDSMMRMWCMANRAAMLLKLGRTSEALEVERSMVDLAEASRSDVQMLAACSAIANALCLTGDWEEARSWCERGTSIEQGGALDHVRTLVEYETGNFELGARFSMRVAEGTIWPRSMPTPASSWLTPKIMRITGDTARAQDVEAVLRKLEREQGAMGQSAARWGLALMAAVRKDRQTALALYDFVARSSGLFSMASPSGKPTDAVLGLLSETLGRTGDAVLQLESAIRFCRESAYRPELAWSLYDCARLKLDRGDPGDREAACRHLDEAHETAAGLGMRPLLGKIEGLRGGGASDTDCFQESGCRESS